MADKKDFQNYEVRKTVRFELIPQFIWTDKKPIWNNENRLKSIFDNLEKLIILHADFVNLFWKNLINENEEIIKEEEILKGNIKIPMEYVTDNNKEEQSKIKKNFSKYEVWSLLQFKYQWLEKVFKNDWIENKKKIKYWLDKDWNEKKKNKNYITLTDLWEDNFVKKYFFWSTSDLEEDLWWFERNKKINIELSKYKFIEHDLSRISDIWNEIQKLNWRNYLWKFYILFECWYLKHKNDVNIISDLKEKLNEIKELIKILLEFTKPSQSFGFPIEHVSLNYYTRNKTPKEYEEEIKKKEVLLKQPYKWNLWELYWINKNQSIESLYKEMKIFKAKEKSAFMQLLQKQTKYENISNPFEYIDFEWNKHENYKIQLFTNIKEIEDNKTKEKLNKEQVYNKVLFLTNQIEKEANKQEKTKLKEKRWKYYFMWKNIFPDYFNFCEYYKKVAMEYWRRKADVLMLEREKILAERERWWWFITKNENQEYFINTIPVEKTEDTYNLLKNWGFEEKEWKISYFMFSSITLRAFDKLCFKKDSSFAKQIKTRICSKFLNEFQNNDWSIRKVIKWKKQLNEENLLLKFYNEVLEVQTTLWIIYRDWENSIKILRNSKDENEFEINLKLECYVLVEYKTNQEKIDNLLKNNNWNSYKITSWDLREKRKKPEQHTKWWLIFWDFKNEENKFPLRINPEITISYVEQDKNFEKLKPDQTNNRRTRERYLLNTTLSHNADSKYIDSAFIWFREWENWEKIDKRLENILLFNENINKNKLDYFYWLDKWTNELITLWLYRKWVKWVIEGVNLSKKIDVYKITNDWLNTTKDVTNKDWSIKTHILYKNPSKFLEFINDEKIFKKQNIISCLWNITSAKIIDWKIILNWDTNTIKKLYEINAKRFIYILIQEQWSKDEKIIFDEKEQIFRYNWKWIYYYNENVKDFTIKEEIEKKLNDYISQIKKFDPKKDELEDISINKINHLKNAVCANMVWVVMKLQEYFKWYIVYETMNNDDTLNKLKKQNTYLWNLINEKIYNKLQFLNEVPPILKQFRSDLDEKNIIQHWKVIYVHEKNTSVACPCCNEFLTKIENWKLVDKKDTEINKLYWHLQWEIWEHNMHHCYNPTDCTNIENHISKENKSKCDYHMKNNQNGFTFINSWDDLATYNIAKKWWEYIKNLDN